MVVKSTTGSGTVASDPINDYAQSIAVNGYAVYPKPTTTGKTLAQIQEGLSKAYSGTLKELDGYSYIPWNDATDAANEIFGVGGFNVEILKTWRENTPTEEVGSFPTLEQALHYPQGYAAIVRVTVSPTDAPSFYRDGLGFSEMVWTKPRTYTDRNTGEQVYVPARPLIDAAIKGVVSRALVRALALFGDAFGLFLYDKEDTQASTGAAPRAAGDNRTLSEKQIAVVVNKCGQFGMDNAKAAALPYATGKKLLDALFSGTAPRQAMIDTGIEVVQSTNKDRLPIPA